MVKPRILYRGTLLPTAITNNHPIIRQKIDKTTYQNWANKTALTDFVDSLYTPPDSDTYLYLKCGCGLEYIYATKTDVPAANTNCSCGQKLFQYGS